VLVIVTQEGKSVLTSHPADAMKILENGRYRMARLISFVGRFAKFEKSGFLVLIK
jgi:hypothetical protein